MAGRVTLPPLFPLALAAVVAVSCRMESHRVTFPAARSQPLVESFPEGVPCPPVAPDVAPAPIPGAGVMPVVPGAGVVSVVPGVAAVLPGVADVSECSIRPEAVLPPPGVGVGGDRADGCFCAPASCPISFEPESPDAWDRLTLGLGERVTVRPIGSSRLLPGALNVRPGSFTGSAYGLGLQYKANAAWRLGMDVVARSERITVDGALQSWSGYAVPGIEYTPYPSSAAPLSLGVVAPVSFGSREPSAGVFIFIRWEEIFGRSKRR